jgi:hypothetical protein
VEIHRSARKHGITDRQILHALDHARLVADLRDDTSPVAHWCLAMTPPATCSN